VSAPTGVGAPEGPVEQEFWGLRSLSTPAQEDHPEVQRDGLDFTVDVTADGEGLISHAGSVLLAMMFASLVLATTAPGAFGRRGLALAVTLVAIQIGRIVFIPGGVGRGHQLTRNFQRVLGWTLLSSVLWLAGGIADDAPRVVLWLIAVAVDYTAPLHGFATPFLGRSLTREWTIDGGYLVSRVGNS
jgi:low temperature requirement protein LtrA